MAGDAPSRTELEAGRRLGPYTLGETVGSGSLGTVFRATHADGSEVALKLLRTELAGDGSFRRRFEREGEISARVSHPGLHPVLDRGESDGIAYLATPFVADGSLADRLGDGPLDLDELTLVVHGVGTGLDALHRVGLVHRDVKPSNVLMTSDGPALTDFGVARGEADTVLTAVGAVVGTVDYLAPEVIAGAPAGPPADVYGLGCLAYECATGRPPFAGAKTIADACRAHLSEPPADPRATRPNLPAPFADSLLTALAKDPADRPGTGTAYYLLLRAGARRS
jgi:serine/threonine protein kinase